MNYGVLLLLLFVLRGLKGMKAVSAGLTLEVKLG